MVDKIIMNHLPYPQFLELYKYLDYVTKLTFSHTNTYYWELIRERCICDCTLYCIKWLCRIHGYGCHNIKQRMLITQLTYMNVPTLMCKMCYNNIYMECGHRDKSYFVCEYCEKYGCAGGYIFCIECKKVSCINCIELYECDGCFKSSCSKCSEKLDKCDNCRNNVCDKCRYECEGCSLWCKRCARYCSCGTCDNIECTS